MVKKFSLADGAKLVRHARKSVSYFMATGSYYTASVPDKKFNEKRGIFVTLNKFPVKELRGCIGLPYPVKRLWSGVGEAAVSAAMRDPRFSPLSSKELDNITIEVSVLSVPVEAEKAKLPGAIEIGKHGLIVSKSFKSGLLLPQVATEFGWDAKTFLEETCHKAGLFETAWSLPESTVKIFSAQVFAETEPDGKIIEELCLFH